MATRSPPPQPATDESPRNCRRCELWRNATHAVEGEGPRAAPMMLVGEQPGDAEDRAARPFVGPAGKLLDTLLADAGVDRSQAFVTNAVKHFKWEPRGKRRIHKTPAQSEIAACEVWLEREIEQVRPRVIVALGATAVRSVLGVRDSIESLRSRHDLARDGTPVVATYHPSALLRAIDDEARERLHDAMLDDLKRAARLRRAAKR